VHATDLEFARTDQHLVEFCQPLLALMSLELRPEFKLLVDNFECLTVVAWELNFLPELVGQVGTLDSLHVKVADTLFLQHSRIAGVSQRARVSGAKSREVVLIAAECLRHSSARDSNKQATYFALNEQCPVLMIFQITSS